MLKLFVRESTEKMPAFLRTTDSVEREFSVPEEYLEKQEMAKEILIKSGK